LKKKLVLLVAVLEMAMPMISYAQFAGEAINSLKPVTITVITGVTPPKTGKTPVMEIENAQYTGTVTWSPEIIDTFKPKTKYTATVTLTAKDGYTLEGVKKIIFKVNRALSTINESLGVVKAVFPSTYDSNNDKKLDTLGISLNIPFPNSPFIISAHGTYAPFNYSFFEFGMDMSWKNDTVSNAPSGLFSNVEIFSLYPFINFALFLPFPRIFADVREGGWYAGAGCGVMFGRYTFDYKLSALDDELEIWDTVFALNIVTGFNCDIFDISFTLRTDFKNFNGKLLVGYVYRLK